MQRKEILRAIVRTTPETYEEIHQEVSVKDAHIFALINRVIPAKSGTLIQDYVQRRYNFKQNKAKYCIGDFKIPKRNIEIKCSLGGCEHNQFNFVQIRLSHVCDYLLTAYLLTAENIEEEGELFLFYVPKENMRTLVLEYGGYAHGTVQAQGKICAENLQTHFIYAIRPKVGTPRWNALMPFRIENVDQILK